MVCSLFYFQNSGQGLYNVGQIHDSTPGHHVGGDGAIEIKKGQDHQLGPAGMDFGLNWPWLALFDPLLALFL